MNKNEILNYLKNQKSYLQKEFGLTKIGLFGSCAKDENMETSDVDILYEVDSNKPFSMFQYLKLNSFLETSLKTKVDLVREETLKNDLKPYVLKDLIYVYK